MSTSDELYWDPFDHSLHWDPHPVWRRMREELLRSTKLFVDETTALVLDPGRGRTKTG